MSESISVRRFRDSERGSVALAFGLLFALMTMFVGSAIDYARAITVSSELQFAADAAALAASRAMLEPENTRISIAEAMFQANTSGKLSDTPRPQISIQGNQVSVTAQYDVPTAFMNLMNVRSIRISTNSHSTATVSTTAGAYGRACLLALQSSGSGIFTNTSIIDANCGLYANSTGSAALDANGTSKISATFTCVSGGYEKDSGATLTPTPTTGCPTMADPFASLVAPSNKDDACT